MSLPNYLAKIKSAGVYRFVWDKSQVAPQQAETLRLVVGYSEKGPFNTPVYIENIADFTTIYGNISKRLERKGVYFHRMAQQALSAGPILAFNMKPFTEEKVEYITFNPTLVVEKTEEVAIKDIYDTNRFWAMDPDQITEKIKGAKYMTIVATDVKDNSCSLFVRKYVPESYKGITFRSWYASQGVEVPEYMESVLDKDMSEYFVEIYVFRGEFNENLYAENAPLARYFNEDGSIKNDFTNIFEEETDALAEMASDSNSNFVNVYSGITIPYFKDANGNYISIDLKFNADSNNHKMLMKLNDEEFNALEVQEVEELKPVYLQGYTYSTIDKSSAKIYDKCMDVLKEKGVRDALTNNVDVEYHYIVDTFDTEEDNGHAEFFQLAKEKGNSFVISNFPKMSKFKNPGSNLKNAISMFPIPGDTQGASFGAYYTQLMFSDGTVKTVVPSAALVSNLFMEKWGARQPYYIVAGPTYGRISYSGLVGPDYNFGRSDLDVLEPMGINAIIFVPRKGTYINSNQTAKQAPVSALSKIHIRELVIFLQNEVEMLLQNYQWELNTQTLRDTIKAKADTICETIKNNGGIYEYKNICDGTNNTAEVIDNEMIVLDTEIEPARGAGKMIHQLTIHKTGGLTSSVR